MRFLFCLLLIGSAFAKEFTEILDRGLVVMPMENNHAYIGWRLLKSDPPDIAFNVYRDNNNNPVKLNDSPITTSTNLIDSTVSLQQSNTWWITPVLEGKEQLPSRKTTVPANPEIQSCIKIKLDGDYGANKIGIADLDGDGVYDYIIKQPRGSLDPGRQRHSPDTYKIEAYNGRTHELMWRHDLGWNMNMGIWFTPAIVFDLDNDGKAEVAFKSAPYAATKEEALISEGGFVLEGPEYCTVLDGVTGKETARVDWIARGDQMDWGDNKGNRVNRNQIGVAYLDGERPALLVLRGTYTKMLIDAYHYIDKKLVKVWSWTGEDENPPLRGQGGHTLHVYDLDDDGRDEIIIGSAVIDDNGKCLWRMDMGHPDWSYLADIDPDHEGLELAFGFEDAQPRNGICLADPQDGSILWGCDFPTTHIHDWGMVADIDPAHPGMEIYGMERDGKTCWLFNAQGELLASNEDLGRHGPRSFYWLDGTTKVRIPFSYRPGTFPILKYKDEKIGEIEGQPIAITDCLGDWREEVICVSDGYIRIYTTTVPATSRHACLMQDPLYRMDVAVQMMGYFYPPQLSTLIKP